MIKKKIDCIKEILIEIYNKKKGLLAFDKLLPLLEAFPSKKQDNSVFFSQEDVVLITYGDSLIKQDEESLKTLREFANRYFKDVFSTIHILPFYPYSSDDGFSVKDFFKVDPKLGSWDDVKELGCNFNLMFDYVLNHISSQSNWFKKYLNGETGFENLAIETNPSTDLSNVTRPRALPLLTEFKKITGKTVWVWTTFSDDQIDLNYKSLAVLEKMVEVLLYYIKQNASILRLDAIAYLWKKEGTNCVHLKKTHDIVKLFRAIFDVVAPDAMLLTETNVPHEENISYFGNGTNEAQMVYNFTLPPLLFHAMVTENATVFSKWVKTLELRSDKNTFFNFTASHDGIGMRPLEGIVQRKEIDMLCEIAKKNGGDVSYKTDTDGFQSPYELNVTYVDALLKSKGKNDDKYHAQRFLASQAVQLSLPGVPAVYIHSILGSHNWKDGVKQTKRARTINRKKLEIDEVISELNNPESFRYSIFFPYMHLIKIRKKQKAFHPNADCMVLEGDLRVFAIKRVCREQTIIVLVNISSSPVLFFLQKQGLAKHEDLITGKLYDDSVNLEPYQYVWLV